MADREAKPMGINAHSALHEAAVEEITEGHLRWGLPILLGLHTGLRRRAIIHFTDEWLRKGKDGWKIETPEIVKCPLEDLDQTVDCSCWKAWTGGPDGYIKPKTGAGEERSIPIWETWHDFATGEERDTELKKWLDRWYDRNTAGFGYGGTHLNIIIKKVAKRRFDEIAEDHQGSVERNLDGTYRETVDIIPHDLRASWCTQCVRCQVDTKQLMDWGGWATDDMIDQYRGFVDDPTGGERGKYAEGPDDDNEGDTANNDVDMKEVGRVYSRIVEDEPINPAKIDTAVLEAAYEMVNSS